MSNGKSDGYNFASPATHVFSIKTKRPQISKSEDMLSQLPHLLTTGVTATREGLVFKDAVVRRNDGPTFWEETTGLLNALQQLGKLQAHKNGKDGVVSWPDAAERLRYREGEPWCTSSDGSFTVDILCRASHVTPLRNAGGIFGETIRDNPLHRLAAILCDDSEAFRILHWCIHNLCNTRTGTNPVEIDGITPDRGHV